MEQECSFFINVNTAGLYSLCMGGDSNAGISSKLVNIHGSNIAELLFNPNLT